MIQVLFVSTVCIVRDLKVTLTSLPHEKKEEIKKANNVDEIFDILEPYCNYVDYDLLEYIIKAFGTSDLQEVMKEYIAELERYEMTTVHDLSLATQGKAVVPAHYKQLAVKRDKDPKECTLHDVCQFKRFESTLESYTLLFQGVICSSVEIFLPFQQRHMQNSWKFLNNSLGGSIKLWQRSLVECKMFNVKT